MQEFLCLKIIEIGARPYLKQVLPEQVTYFSTGPGAHERETAREVASLSTLSDLWRAVRDPSTSLVVCHPAFFSPWHWRWLTRVLFDRRVLHRVASFPRIAAPQMLRWRTSVPVAICDHEDLPVINRNNFFLLDRCCLYFKRELPPDRWRLFLKTGHANLPTVRYRKSPAHRARIEKLRPISLGLPLTTPRPFPVTITEKKTDIFFAGLVDGSSSVRQRGLPELLALRERGVVVDVPERRLTQSEFFDRCAQARLTWSPEGLGWDCFRHYEASMCGSVPLINRPTIERYQPLLSGEHAFYYDIEEGELSRAAVSALADARRLEAMGRAARAHVLAHHTPEAIARYIVRTCLESLSRSDSTNHQEA
jgi:glycosyl transferase family 1